MINSSLSHFTIRPLRREPIYIKQVRELVRLTGGAPTAVAEKFRQAKINVEVVGDSAPLLTSMGALIVGDHRLGVEFAPLLAALGDHGRQEALWLAKPFSHNARIMSALDPSTASPLVAPVLPSTLARDRRDIWNSDLHWRLREWHRLPGLDRLRELNQASLSAAVNQLERGQAVTIYPTGRIADAGRAPWHRGVGSIVNQLDPSARDKTAVLLIRFDHFSSLRLLQSLVAHGHGLQPYPYKIRLRVVSVGTAADLLHTVDGRALTDQEITGRLRRHYIAAFRGTAFQNS